jgi:hypothetical protein
VLAFIDGFAAALFAPKFKGLRLWVDRAGGRPKMCPKFLEDASRDGDIGRDVRRHRGCAVVRDQQYGGVFIRKIPCSTFG